MLDSIQRGTASVFNRIGIVKLLVFVGVLILVGLLWFNNSSNWIRENGGLAGWLQTVGSLYAIVAVSIPVFLERNLAVERARRSVLASAEMACGLMRLVASRAFDETAQFSEWWVPQWEVIDEVMASCPIHEIHSAEALEAFITIRELYGRMRSWDESSDEPWPREQGPMMGYVGTLCMNASTQLESLRSEFAQN